MERLNPSEKSSIECRINSFHFSGISGNINGSAICAGKENFKCSLDNEIC